MVKKKGAQVSSLHIRGVVKAMTLARQRVNEGLDVAEVQDFRRWVRAVIKQVEQICRENGLRPEQLQAPTLRAYQYLKRIDLQHLPIYRPPSKKGTSAFAVRETPRQQVRVAHLIKTCNHIQLRLAECAQTTPKHASGVLVEPALLRYIQFHVQNIEVACEAVDSTPADLPARSRHAFEWLKFLSSEANLAQHLAALSAVLQFTREAGRKQQPVNFMFFHLAAIYRSRVESGVLQVVASEGFIGAPQAVLAALVRSALDGKKGPDLAIVLQYANSPSYAATLAAFQQPVGNHATAARGQHFDLLEVFHRVNAQYFENRMEQPHLTWNRTITHRKLGHYQPATDTVMISITLDQPKTPLYLVDYIMYHELLHKKLGIKVVQGRHYAHTAIFRQEERKFKHYAQAQAFLKKLGEKLDL